MSDEAWREAERRWPGIAAAIEGPNDADADDRRRENADFIAFARMALPALIAEVREHRAREAMGYYAHGCMDTDDGLVWSMFETEQEARDELDAGEVVARQWRGPWEVVTNE